MITCGGDELDGDIMAKDWPRVDHGGQRDVGCRHRVRSLLAGRPDGDDPGLAL
jgi:hypothetical protein